MPSVSLSGRTASTTNPACTKQPGWAYKGFMLVNSAPASSFLERPDHSFSTHQYDSTSVDSLQCNIARATIITDLNEFSILLQKIDTSNETVALAVSDARDGLKTAGDCDHVDSTGFNCRRRYRGHVASFDSTEPAASDALSKLNDAAAAAAEVGAVCR
uniref:Uncharacterized protein n=1 Tax=Moniliophthora roreri TaxID=221103 RepID=A0A0W0FQD1_MONRR